MGERAFSREQIPRGADLTDHDLAVIATDMRIVCMWAMRNRIKRQEWERQLREALRARLGRRPLVIADPIPQAKEKDG